MECEVRIVTIGDASQIFRNLFIKGSLNSVTEGLSKDIEKMKPGEFLRCVAVCDGDVVGQAEFTIPGAPIKKHLVEISGMVVMGGFQGKGLSSKLLDFGLRWAKSKNVRIAILSARKGTKAEEVYKHWGFEVYGELAEGIVEPWEDAKTYDEVLMCKNI